MRAVLLAGADKTSLNTAGREGSGSDPPGRGSFGNQCVVLAVDAKTTG